VGAENWDLVKNPNEFGSSCKGFVMVASLSSFILNTFECKQFHRITLANEIKVILDSSIVQGTLVRISSLLNNGIGYII
jgi:hypothetical protein